MAAKSGEALEAVSGIASREVSPHRCAVDDSTRGWIASFARANSRRFDCPAHVRKGLFLFFFLTPEMRRAAEKQRVKISEAACGKLSASTSAPFLSRGRSTKRFFLIPVLRDPFLIDRIHAQIGKSSQHPKIAGGGGSLKGGWAIGRPWTTEHLIYASSLPAIGFFPSSVSS